MVSRRNCLFRRVLLCLVLGVALLPLAVTAQQPQAKKAAAPASQPAVKRALTHNDYDAWRAIQLQQLSQDGRILTYALVPQDGDGEVVVMNLATGKEYRHPRGHRPETTSPAESSGEENGAEEPDSDQRGPAPGGRGAGAGGSQLALTGDGRFAVFQAYPAKAETETARKARKRPEEMPKNSMGIMDLSTGQVEKVEKVRRFQVSEEGGYLAYLLEPKTEERPATERAPDAAAGGRGGAAGSATRRAPARAEYGSDLILRNLQDKNERTFADVLDFTLTKDAKTLVYTVSSRKNEANGVYRVATGSQDAPLPLLAGKGKYTRLTWDEKQSRLVFSSDRDDAAAKQPKTKLYYADSQSPAAVEILSTSTPGFRQGFVISDRGPLSFSQDGSKLFFAISRPPEPEPSDEEGAATAPPVDEEKVVADLWHWKDDFIQPMQKVRLEQERNRSYRAVFHLQDKKLVQLADESLQDVNPSQDSRWGLGSDDRKYRMLVGWDTNYSDYFLVDTNDGSRKQLLSKQSGGVSFSPGGKFALYFDGENWNSISIPDGRTVNLTRGLGVAFWNENNDSPSAPGSYGNGGWSKDDKYVLLYDRYDIWQVSPDGTGAKNLTDGVGRNEKITFRTVRLDPEERSFDPQQPILLRAENESTRDSGFYRDRIDGGLPQKVIMQPRFFSPPVKAKNADVYLLTASTFNEFPDLLVSGPSFSDLKKVSNANPQKEGLLWGTSELVRFKNSDGVPLSAILFKPENFDPAKKYPMMVYIYERLSEGVHRFVNPAPSHSINVSYYVSNGYLVLEPDIVYTIGYPGQSALKCVLPAIQAVVDKGFVDEKTIGIQGHSWGGYQIAYMVTQTDRFRAAAPGALVANMTSAYSGIRWGTGLPRQFQYEKTQSRIGGTLWEYPMRFIQNSAVFQADRVHTPILMLHNDNDDAVPWYQGIEFYLALRRLGKEVYMWNYNGEPHGIRKRPNQKDYTLRLQQFFDHYLKGAPEPEWMTKGIPYIDREKEKERIKPAP
jgi:dipeptidyl aminopeptidase/acylaminoacyl peptidase